MARDGYRNMQLRLDKLTHHELRLLAAERDASMTDIVRRYVKAGLRRETRRKADSERTPA